MQFRKRTNRIQVLAYRGYNREKNRNIVKMLGSLDARSFEPSNGLMEKLTTEEQDELNAYVETKKALVRIDDLQVKTRAIPADIADIAIAITAGDLYPTEQWAQSLWFGIDLLSKAMRKTGLPKSHFKIVKPRQSPKNESNQFRRELFMTEPLKASK